MKTNLPSQPVHAALPGDIEPDYTYTVEQEPVHLRDYWKILVKRRRWVIGIFLGVVALGAYIPLTATPMYTATATIKIEPQQPQVTGVEMTKSLDIGGPYDYYQTQFKLLLSRTLAAKVISDLKLESNQSFTNGSITSSNPIVRIKGWTLGNVQFLISQIESLFERSPKQNRSRPAPAQSASKDGQDAATEALNVSPALIGRYMGFLTVNPVKNTRLVEIEFTTPDPELSQVLANAHAAGFIRLVLESRFELTKEARDFLDSKNVELKRKLERSEDALNRFRQQHGVVSLDKGENIVVERLVDLNRQLTVARAQRLDAESLSKTVAGKSTQHLAQVLTQGLIPNLRANLLALEAEKIKVSTVFKAEHPRMIELNQQINDTKRALNTEIANVIRGIEEAFVAARAREQALETEAQKQQQAALSLKELGVQYAVLDEEVKVNRALYETTLKRLNETTVLNDVAISNMQITQRADMPRFRSSPDVPGNIVIFAVLGLMLGVGFAYFLEYLDSKVATPEQVWKAVALNTFGVVPDLGSLRSRVLERGQSFLRDTPLKKMLPETKADASPPRPELITAHHPLSIITESYRTIRTALLFSQAEKPPQVMLLTSPSPGEGKTITTLNLAITLAQDGYKVLVIDADLRKGSCHSRLGVKNHRGLSNILSGHLSLEKGIQKTTVNGLSLITRGLCPPNPSELLGSRMMREVLTNLRESYNFILIDSPPVIAVSDAAVLSVVADGVLLVLNSQRSTTASARQAVARLDAVRAPVLGVILNSIDLGNPDYSYYRSYYGPSFADFEEAEKNLTGNGNESTQAEVLETLRRNQDPLSIQREFFDRMIAKLREFTGPMAPHIVNDAIAFIGESVEHFPRWRLDELVDRICQELLDENTRTSFSRWVAKEIRSTDSTTSATTN